MARAFTFRDIVLSGVAVLGVVTLPAASSRFVPVAEAASSSADVLSNAVGKPLQAASAAFSRKNYAKAMASVATADAVKGKTEYESYTINQMRAAIASASGDHTAASRAYQALIASSRSTVTEKHQMMMALATNAYMAKDYGQAVTYIRQYLKSAGPDAPMQNLLVQAYYLQNDFANAAKTQRDVVDAVIHAGHKPSENALQFLATCYHQTHQADQETHAYVLLAKYYPKPEYWERLIHDLAVQPKMAPSLRFNLMRLRAVTGTLKTPSAWVDMSERAVQIGLPQLGLKLLDQGLEARVIGGGADASRMQRLRSLMVSRVKDITAQFAQARKNAASDLTGRAAVTTGYNLILSGQIDDGTRLMQEGISKISGADRAIAQLGYAMALRDAGRADRAIKAFDSVSGEATAENLAQLWEIITRHPAVPAGRR